MTDAEIIDLKRAAAQEFANNETEMLVSPLSILGLVERLTRCEQQRRDAEAYDVLR